MRIGVALDVGDEDAAACAHANARGLRRRLIVDIPHLTPRLSSYWVDFVTPVHSQADS